MCYTISYAEQRAARISERYKKLFPTTLISNLPERLTAYYLVSGFSHPELPIVTQNGLILGEWGLIPKWIKDENAASDIRKMTLNAVGESAFEKPSFKHSMTTQRCLLPVNGFYEWRDFNGIKYPYFIQLKNLESFSLGCIYADWMNPITHQKKTTFSILTTPANSLMEKIHNLKKRMPLIIHPENEERWISPTLNNDEINNLILPYEAQEMRAYTISMTANAAKNDRNNPEILIPVGYQELQE